MKHATKDMAIAAKETLEKQISPLPLWIKSIELDCDDHGWFLSTKVKNKTDYIASNIKIPSTIDVNGFKLKNCFLILG